MKLICKNCGKKFEFKRHKQTCSDVCAKARQKKSIEQMRSGTGDMFERWRARVSIGMGYKDAKKRLK